MYSYQIKLEKDVLIVGFNRVKPAQGDVLVLDTFEQLEMMINNGEIPTEKKLLKIDGPQSIPVAYVIAHKLAHLYEAIAVLDPKIGKKGYKNYIVTTTHGSKKYKVGQIIETKDILPQRSKIKVVLCGPPQSGKSCLREGLKQAILSNLNAPYPYVITACPDGEGAWYQKSYANDEQKAQQAKINKKGEVTLDFAKNAKKWVKGANQLINIIDVGGKISPENEIIMKEATHAVILSGNPDKFQEWEEFCQQLELKIIAKIESKLEASKDEINLVKDWQNEPEVKLKKAPLLTGIVHNLVRGEDLVNRKMIRQLAEILIILTKC